MSIEKIKNKVDTLSGPNLFSAKAVKNRVHLDSPQDSVSFTGTGKAAAKATTDITEYLLSIMPGGVKWMKNAHEGMGEVQNQLINAIGTGLVAPMFIKFNPFSKTDEDTRTYTAWRQPVSAVLAVCTQAAIVIPFNKLIQELSDIGYFRTGLNASLFPSDNYLKKEVKQLNPGKKFTKDEMKEAIELRKKEYSSRFVKMIEEDKIVFNTTNGVTDGTLEMPKAEFKKLFEETLDAIIKEEKEQRLQAVQKKLPKKIERGIFLHDNPNETIVVLQRLQGKINQLYNQTNMNNSEDIINANKIFNKECKAVIKGLEEEIKKDSTKEKLNKELIKIVKEIRDKNTGSDPISLKLLDEKITKILNNIEIMRSKDTKEIIEYVTETVTRRTDAIDGTIATLEKIKDKLATSDLTVKEAQAIVNEEIAKSFGTVAESLKAKGSSEAEIKSAIEWIECTGSRLTEKAKSLAKRIAEQQKKHVKANIDGMKRWTGLGVSLAILPFTCWLLNKIYPWFMDLAFPELSNKAASAKKNKYNKPQEVANGDNK